MLAGIVVAAVAVRVAWFLYTGFRPTINDDAGRYDLLGRSLAHAAGYINPNGTTTLFWPPGYPMILAAVYRLFDDSVRVALTLNALFEGGTIIVLYALARRAFDPPAALLAAALYALLPSAIFYSGVTLSETSFTFVLMLALWLLVEAADRRSAALFVCAGVTVGYATLIRGQAALLPVVAVPFWLRWPAEADAGDGKRGGIGATGMRAAAWRMFALGLIALVVIAPWTVRNYVESRHVVLISTNAGVDFYIGHSAGADGRGRIVDELVYRYPGLPEPRAEAKVSQLGFRRGLSYLVRHPIREAELAARKVFWLWSADHEALRWTDGHGERAVLRHGVKVALGAASDAYYWALIALAIAGAWRAGGRGWLSFSRDGAGAVRLLLVSLVAYWTLAHVAFFADPRFHAPMMPVLCAWAAAGLIAVAAGAARRRTHADVP